MKFDTDWTYNSETSLYRGLNYKHDKSYLKIALRKVKQGGPARQWFSTGVSRYISVSWEDLNCAAKILNEALSRFYNLQQYHYLDHKKDRFSFVRLCKYWLHPSGPSKFNFISIKKQISFQFRFPAHMVLVPEQTLKFVSFNHSQLHFFFKN